MELRRSLDWVIFIVGIALALKWYIGIVSGYLHRILYAQNFQRAEYSTVYAIIH